MRWGGVVSFYASEHAMRARSGVLERAELAARLVPGPREVSPNCGVAVAFVWDQEPEVEQALRDAKVRFEAIHRYALDDETRAPQAWSPKRGGRCEHLQAQVGRRHRGDRRVRDPARRGRPRLALDLLHRHAARRRGRTGEICLAARDLVLDDGGLTDRPERARPRDEQRGLPLGRRREDLDAIRVEGRQHDEHRPGREPPAALASVWPWTAGPVVEKTGGTLKERSAPPGPAVFATSTDGGKTWKTTGPAGLPKVAIQSLTVDPGNAKTIYAVTTTGAFYRSTDGAHSFSLASSKLGIPPWAIAVTKGTRTSSAATWTTPRT